MSTINLFDPDSDSPEKPKHNIWKYLTIGVGTLFVAGLIVRFCWTYVYPAVDSAWPIKPAASAAPDLGTGLVGVLAGVVGMIAIIVLPILAILIPAIIVGFGFGIGFGASDIGKAIRRRP